MNEESAAVNDTELEMWVRRLDLHQLEWCRERLKKLEAALDERVSGAAYHDKPTFTRRLARTRFLLQLVEEHSKKKGGAPCS